MNSDALQKENIELILKLMPTAEEISMITDQQQQRPGAPLASGRDFSKLRGSRTGISEKYFFSEK